MKLKKNFIPSMKAERLFNCLMNDEHEATEAMYLSLESNDLMQLKQMFDDYFNHCTDNRDVWDDITSQLSSMDNTFRTPDPQLVSAVHSNYERLRTKFYYEPKSIAANNYLPEQVEKIQKEFERTYGRILRENS